MDTKAQRKVTTGSGRPSRMIYNHRSLASSPLAVEIPPCLVPFSRFFGFLSHKTTHVLMQWIQRPKGKLQKAQDNPPGGFTTIVQGVPTLWLWRYHHSPTHFRDFRDFEP